MLNQEQFNQFRRDLSGQDPLVKKVRLSEIELHPQSIENNFIVLQENKIPVSSKFFGRLGNLVNLKTGLITTMDKNEDRQIAVSLLKAVKTYAESNDKNTEFLLIGNRETKEITDITNANKYNRLSNDTLFATTETIMNEVPDMHIQSIDNYGGNLSINLIHGHEADLRQFGPDEMFRFGISLVNQESKSAINDFFYRLSCENGAIARSGPDDFGGGGLGFGGGPTGDKFRELLNLLNGWSKKGFMPTSFQSRLETAMNTKASFAEMELAMVAVSSSIMEKDQAHKETLVKAFEAQFFPEYDMTAKRIFRAGHNPLTLTTEQKRFIKTDASVWDLVNDLTWIGSHTTAFDLKNPNRFKVEGGRLFTKTYDLQHAGLAQI